MELFETIRREHDRHRLGIRALARKFRVGRATVRRALSSAIPPEPRSPARAAPVMGPAKAFIDQVLVADHQVPRKQRHTARRIWQRVRSELGISVAESTVRQYVRERRRELGERPEVMVPQVHDPGKEAEVDFFEASVVLAGVTTKLTFFQMRACHSGRVFVRAVARATQQAFLECMVQAFSYFSGVFTKVKMDNHRDAVSRVLRGRRRIEVDRFIALRSHYLFESVYCRVGEQGAHEKGGVEGGQGHFRRNHLTPLPRVRDLLELNDQLLSWCAEDDQRTPEGKSESKLVAWEREEDRLRPLPDEPFPTLECVEKIRIDDKSRARVKGARYSVPVRYAGRLARAEVSSDRVLVFCGRELAANWERCWQPNGERLELDHYLEVFQHKPLAFASSVPLRQAQAEGRFPTQYCQLFSALTERLGESEAARQMVDVLLLHRRYPREVVDQAVSGALTAGVIDGGAVALLVRRSLEGRPLLVVLQLNDLDRYQRPQPDTEAYDALLSEVKA